MTAERPVAQRAILTAFSTASAPEFTRIERCSSAAARGELGEALAHLHVRLVDADHEALVEVAVGLLLDGLDDRCVPVAGVLTPDPSGEVDVRVSVGIGDARTLGMRDDELRRRHPGGDVAGAVGEDPLGGCRVSRLHRAIICP